jgi:hypothetical protein
MSEKKPRKRKSTETSSLGTTGHVQIDVSVYYFYMCPVIMTPFSDMLQRSNIFIDP